MTCMAWRNGHRPASSDTNTHRSPGLERMSDSRTNLLAVFSAIPVSTRDKMRAISY